MDMMNGGCRGQLGTHTGPGLQAQEAVQSQQLARHQAHTGMPQLCGMLCVPSATKAELTRLAVAMAAAAE